MLSVSSIDKIEKQDFLMLLVSAIRKIQKQNFLDASGVEHWNNRKA
jgi:hypothetical protein